MMGKLTYVYGCSPSKKSLTSSSLLLQYLIPVHHLHDDLTHLPVPTNLGIRCDHSERVGAGEPGGIPHRLGRRPTKFIFGRSQLLDCGHFISSLSKYFT